MITYIFRFSTEEHEAILPSNIIPIEVYNGKFHNWFIMLHCDQWHDADTVIFYA